MANSMVTVIAKVRAKEGMQARLLESLLGLVEPTRAEPGCVQYEIHESCADRAELVLYETWRSQADLDRHQAMPYMRAFMESAGELLGGPVEVAFLERKT